MVIPRVAAQIKELKHQRAIVAEVEKLLDDFPLSRDLMSMPGVGIKTAATTLLTIGDAGTFTSTGHLAAYAGIAPVTRRSGTSIHGKLPARSGNKQLKNALFRSAWIASCHHPASKAYYQKKRDQGIWSDFTPKGADSCDSQQPARYRGVRISVCTRRLRVTDKRPIDGGLLFIAVTIRSHAYPTVSLRPCPSAVAVMA
jgi:hypothetical protein